VGNNRFIWGGLAGGLAAVAVWFFSDSLIIALICGTAAFALLALVFRPRGSIEVTSGGITGSRARDAIAEAETQVKELRSYTAVINNVQIRNKLAGVCETIRRILDTMREKPEDVSVANNFFNYYLPVLVKLIGQYRRIEVSGTNKHHAETVLNYLGDIETAMQKQLSNLFEDDIFDMSAEIKSMTTSMKSEGLLSDGDFK